MGRWEEEETILYERNYGGDFFWGLLNRLFVVGVNLLKNKVSFRFISYW